MPLIHIELLAGRSKEQLEHLVHDVTEAVTKNTGAPKEEVRIILNEMQKDHYAIGGVMKSNEEK